MEPEEPKQQTSLTERSGHWLTPGRIFTLDSLKICFIYLVFGILWIIFSDRIFLSLAKQQEDLVMISSIKGILFIIVTTGFLFLLIQHFSCQLRDKNEQLRVQYNDLKSSREKIQQSEEKYRELVENANSIILKWDKGGNITFFNEFAQRFFGYTHDEIIGKPVMGTIVPATESESERDLRLLIEDIVRHPEDHVLNENENITRDGKRVWIRWQNKPLLDENGQFTGLLSIGTDITERRQAEEALQKAHDELEIRVQERTAALRESEERLKLKLDSVLSPDTDISDLEIINVLDVAAIQSLMEDFSRLTGMSTAIVDMKGKVIESSGWRDICTKFHRVNERSAGFCTESDLYLTRNLKPGQYVAYKCRNNLWDVVTPLFIGEKQIGNIFSGQFFYDDETIEDSVFLTQAEEFGFDREKYMAALRCVPRFQPGPDQLPDGLPGQVYRFHIPAQLQ